ncbi:MAG TPA: ABC transporter permease [Blastocatellia bacterium]|nr:ABC transporter permease [Blastocatellia bacterium]
MADVTRTTRFRFWLWLIALIGVIVPRRLRGDWRQEWEAELRYRESLMAEWDKLDWRAKLALLWHSLGAFADALWLQPKRLEEEMFQDMRYGVRMLLKHKGVTAVAALTLMLGIGANTAIFSVVNAVLLRPLPFPEPERIVWLRESHPPTNLPQFSVAFGNFLDWRSQNQVFAQMAAYREDGFNLQAGDEPKRVNGARVTVDLFATLGIQPAMGRAFFPAEDAPGGERVVVLSYALWRKSFGGDPQLVGRQLKVDGQSHTVVGIMPPGFSFPGDDTELWLPYALDPKIGRQSHFLRVLGRLKPGATLQQARAEFEAIALRLEQAYPDTNKGWRVFMLPLGEAISGRMQEPLYMLLGAVLFVLLIACANVANLLLSRNAARERELAVRVALGAGRGRIVRQLLTESLLLALLGAAGGLSLAALGVKALTTLGPRDIPRLNEATIDLPVLGFTLAVALLTSLIFGMAPAWQRSRININTALKDGARMAGSGARRLRQSLVIVEIAFALLLLIGAGLMLKSFVRLQQVAPGFDARNGLTMEINLAQAKYARREQRAAFLQQVIERLKALPGVEFAGATHRLPLKGNSGMGFQIEGRPAPPPGQSVSVNWRSVTPDYFRAMGAPLIAGRTFTEEEAWEKMSAVIINQATQRRYWPDENPLGKRIRQGGAPDSPWVTIVGVAADVRESGLNAETEAGMYLPYVLAPAPAMTLVLRTGTEPLSLAAAAGAAIRQVDSEQAVSNISTLEQLLNETVAQPRFNTALLALFALLALLLAAVGIYGVMSYAVAQRTQEIGLRMAMGAGPRDVLKLVIGQGMKLVAVGLALGLLAALGVTRWLKALLFDVEATDPLTYAVIAATLAAVALLACYLPARRAMTVDPLVALRRE